MYCANCGAKDPESPCKNCGGVTTTSVPASDTPCAYCGATPSWQVDYRNETSVSSINLCAQCDQAEADAFDEGDDDYDDD